MSGSGTNRALDAPPAYAQQNSSRFDKGKAIFGRLQADDIREYTNFQNLNDAEMTSHMMALKIWKD